MVLGRGRLLPADHASASGVTIQMQVRNPLLGFLFGYRGEFTCTFPALSAGGAPEHLKPVREESRE